MTCSYNFSQYNSWKRDNYMQSNTKKKPIYKPDTKNEGKRLKATTLAIAKLEEQELNVESKKRKV